MAKVPPGTHAIPLIVAGTAASVAALRVTAHHPTRVMSHHPTRS
jgi:hypothetical protein